MPSRLVFLVVGLTFVACASEVDLESESSSALQKSPLAQATIRGEHVVDSTTNDSLVRPESYLGRTIALHQGEEIFLGIWATQPSVIYLYSPASTAIANVSTAPTKGGQYASLDVVAPTEGTYTLVFGPKKRVDASYTITSSCLAACMIAVGAPCRLDAECADGFCGCPDSSCTSRVCTGWATEGEACGGSTWDAAVCISTLACAVPDEVMATTAGNCGAPATVSDLMANPAAYDGHYVAIEAGYVDHGAEMCTKIACWPADPCCNTCTAQERVYDDASQVGSMSGIFLIENGSPLTCDGDECHLTCPFVSGRYWVSGWFTLADGGITPQLAVDHRYAY